ncbi:hypothetical protein GGI43DRAFT_171852 [Trichoderma evansii]
MKPLEFFRLKWGRYERVNDTEQAEKRLDNSLDDDTPVVLAPKPRSQLFWKLSTAICLGLAIYFFAQTIRLHRNEQFSTGFSNEMLLATPAIQVSQHKFTGGIKFHDNGTMFRDNGPGLSYVGRPTAEIHENWEALIGTRYLAFTESQRATLQVPVDQSPDDNLYRAGPDVLHSLHCVNKLRQTIDTYMYGPATDVDESPPNVLHLEHCLDFLRQLVQCTSDLTPIPLVFSKGAGFAIPDFEQVHTCRNFDAIHSWAMKQNRDALKSAGKEEGNSVVP